MGGGEGSTRPGWAWVSPKHDVKAVGCVSKLTRSWPRTEWRAASLRRGWASATEDTREDGSGALREPGRGRHGELQGPRTLQPHLAPPVPPFTNLVGVFSEPTLETRELGSHDHPAGRGCTTLWEL